MIIIIIIAICTSLIILGISIYYIIPCITKQPVLKNLGVDFEAYNNETGRAGAFIFLKNEDKVFLEFGAEVSGENGVKKLPTFEYIVAKDSNVYAIGEGIVTNIEYQDETQDYEIIIKPCIFSIWLIIIDHVLNLTISIGDKVVAGMIIGKPGTYTSLCGRVEIQIYNMETNLNYAPFKLFDPTLRDEYEQKVWQLMDDWETFKNNISIYDQDSMIYAGCLYETMVESEY